MRKVLIVLFALSLFSCSSSKVNTNELVVKTNFKGVEIAKTTKVINSDTVTFNELRFHNIDSASDTMKSMFLDYGTWYSRSDGLHQENMTRKAWENIKLFETDERFTIVADGTESINGYFACLTVFDSQGKDCFDENHPLKNRLIKFFNNRMNANRKKDMNYWKLR